MRLTMFDRCSIRSETCGVTFAAVKRAMSSNNPNSGRIFQNPVLEALTKTHIAVPLVIFWLGIAAAYWVSFHDS